MKDYPKKEVQNVYINHFSQNDIFLLTLLVLHLTWRWTSLKSPNNKEVYRCCHRVYIVWNYFFSLVIFVNICKQSIQINVNIYAFLIAVSIWFLQEKKWQQSLTHLISKKKKVRKSTSTRVLGKCLLDKFLW